MALNFKKVEVSPIIEPVIVPQKVMVQPEPSEIEILTTEYIDLYKKFVYFEVKTLVKRMEEIRKQLQLIANDTMDADLPAVFTSPHGKVVFSERGKTTEVVEPLLLIKVLLDKFGAEATASVIDVALTPLRKLMSEFELKGYLMQVPGSRTVRRYNQRSNQGG